MQIDIRHILVPTAFGETEPVALAYALDLARRLRARITVLHVAEANTRQVAVFSGRDPYLALDDITAYARARLEESVARLGDTAPVAVEPVVEVGVASSEVMAWAREHAVDLVVMARHSDRLPGVRSVFGSVVRHAVHNRHVAVLLIDGEEDAPTVSPCIRSMFVPSDLTEASGRGLVAAMHLARALGHERIAAGHVVQIPGWARVFGGTQRAQEHLETLRAEALRDLQTQISACVPDGIVEARAAINADVPSGILDLGHDAGADLFVVPGHAMGAVGATLVGSTAQRVAELSRKPVLLLPHGDLAHRD